MNNTNLLNNILSYLKPKDFANLEVVSRDYKLKAENFRNYWREDLNNLLCGNYSHFSVLDNKQIEEELLKQNFEINFFSCVEEKGTFKNLYKDYILNRKFMQNFKLVMVPTSDFNNSNIQEDLIFTENLISQVFREFFESPELRRKNYYLENEYNTTHQINNFDFIYKQQDIYEYYDEIFGNKNTYSQINSNKLEESPTLSKRPDLPFSALLNNISSILYLFRKEDNLEQKMILAKLRWYCNDDKANNYHNDHNENDYLSYLSNFSSPCAPCGTNPLNIIISTIFSKMSIFCRFSYQYITKYQNFNKNSFSYDDANTNQILDQLLIHEYIKRSKSFFQAAIYLDAQLENLNVIVNYCYENEFKNYPCFPKFSIYRLLVVMWNKEVLAPLVETSDQNLNILLKIQKMYKNYLEFEIEEIGKNHCESESESKFKFKFNLSCDYRYFPQNYQETKSLNDPKLIKYLIEEIASSLVDMDCNEYSTFFLNHSQMKISRNYSILENLLSNTFEEVLRKYFSASFVNRNDKGIFSSNSNSNFNNNDNINFIPVLNYFKDLGLDCHPTHPRLINRTRNLLMKILCKFGVDFSLDYITKIFEVYLKNNYSLLSEQKIENFFLETRNKLNQCNLCNLYLLKFKEDNLNHEIKLIQEGLFEIAKEFLFLRNKFKNENLARLLTINFIREFPLDKINFEYLKILEEAMIHFNEDLERLKFLDKKITKETTRRNIPFDSSEIFFLKFEQIDFSQVEQIYLSNLNLDISYIQIFSKGNKGFLKEKESYEISMKDDYSDNSDNRDYSDNSTASSLSSSLQSPGRIHEDINMEVEYFL